MNILSGSAIDGLEDEIKPKEAAAPMVIKKDYNKMTITEQFEYKRLQKLEKHNKLILISQYSQTHEWSADGEFSTKARVGSTLRGSYAPMAGNCKRCGNHYQLFKLNPAPCPNPKP
jgi:hypothetical protein